MDKKTKKIEITQHIEYGKICEDIFVYCLTKYVDDEPISKNFGIAIEDEIENMGYGEYDSQAFSKLLGVAFVKKELIEKYRNIYYGSCDFFKLYKLAIDAEGLFNLIKEQSQEIENYIPLYIDNSDGCYYRYREGCKKEWLPHMIAFRKTVHMCTSEEYDIPSLKEYLAGREDVLISAEGNYCDDETDDYIQYIDFYVRITNYEDYALRHPHRYFDELDKSIIDLGQFKKIKE